MAVDAKDQITHGHIRRVQVYAVELARRLGVSEERQIKAIEAAALLHDMGKLAIPEHILNKPGRLTPAEFDRMKTHAGLGADLLSSIRFPIPSFRSFGTTMKTGMVADIRQVSLVLTSPLGRGSYRLSTALTR